MTVLACQYSTPVPLGIVLEVEQGWDWAWQQTPAHFSLTLGGGAATTTVGARVSVEDTELMPSQVRQGKQLHVKHRRVSGSSC